MTLVNFVGVRLKLVLTNDPFQNITLPYNCLDLGFKTLIPPKTGIELS